MMDVAPRGHETGLLERSVAFALGALGGVTPGTLGLPTPCRGWDLGMLLVHVDESMAALYEAVDTGSVRLAPGPDLVGTDVVAAFRLRAHRLLGAWTAGREERVVTVGGCPLQARVVAGMGAIELAVHGWDIARATGRPRDIPAGLAEQLLPIARMMADGETRAGLFAREVEAPSSASVSDRLVAYLGRKPGRAFTA